MPSKTTKTVIFDSSVWVALFTKNDKFQKAAQHLFNEIRAKNHTIIVPQIIYLETMIVLKRTGSSVENLESVHAILTGTSCHQLDKKLEIDILFNCIKNLHFLNLKTNDFIITSIVLETRPDFFYTFDQAMKKEYIKLKTAK